MFGNSLRVCLDILFLSLPLAALAASNPEVVRPECDQRTVAESCGGVTPPVPGEAFAVAGCTNFAFRIEDPLPGRERIDRREVWYGGANWRVTGPDGWMPNAGSFADDGQRTFAVRPETVGTDPAPSKSGLDHLTTVLDPML